MTPLDVQQWLEILAKPTAGLIAFLILIFYKDLVIHFGKTILDILASWLKRKP